MRSVAGAATALGHGDAGIGSNMAVEFLSQAASSSTSTLTTACLDPSVYPTDIQCPRG